MESSLLEINNCRVRGLKRLEDQREEKGEGLRTGWKTVLANGVAIKSQDSAFFFSDTFLT